jgi:hypothetical protein
MMDRTAPRIFSGLIPKPACDEISTQISVHSKTSVKCITIYGRPIQNRVHSHSKNYKRNLANAVGYIFSGEGGQLPLFSKLPPSPFRAAEGPHIVHAEPRVVQIADNTCPGIENLFDGRENKD